MAACTTTEPVDRSVRPAVQITVAAPTTPMTVASSVNPAVMCTGRAWQGPARASTVTP